MQDRRELIHRFFPSEADRKRASQAIGGEAARLLANFPQDLVQKVQALKVSGLSLKQISEALDHDPRIPEIALHLAVKGQAEEIARS